MGNLLGVGGASHYPIGKLFELFANRVAWVFGPTASEVTDGGLRTTALSGNLRLTPSGSLKLGDNVGPIHGPNISDFRCLIKRISDEPIG